MITLLTLIVLVLAAITIVRLVRVLELVNDLNDEKEEITEADNKFNSWMMLTFGVLGLFFAGYCTLHLKKFLLPVSATKHGIITDKLLDVNFLIIGIVFFITNFLLFYFSFRYRHRKHATAYFYPINHKLEFVWTFIPTLVLGGLIIYGLNVWNNITKPAPKNAMRIEVYGKQFDWTVRYTGEDKVLGKSNFRLITDENPLGVDSNDQASGDDKIAKELHLPVGVPIVFSFHSRDIIHSAYMPHLRTQMNCVPGMTTTFHIEPFITTDSMRLITKNPNFDYVLLCNKICGAAHFNMKMKVVIDTQDQFREWYKKQQYVFAKPEAPAAEPAAKDTSAKQAEVMTNAKKPVIATR